MAYIKKPKKPSKSIAVEQLAPTSIFSYPDDSLCYRTIKVVNKNYNKQLKKYNEDLAEYNLWLKFQKSQKKKTK